MCPEKAYLSFDGTVGLLVDVIGKSTSTLYSGAYSLKIPSVILHARLSQSIAEQLAYARMCIKRDYCEYALRISA